MEQYIVSARKYRPSTFRSVVGQKSLTMTLKNAIDSDRLAQAYLFCGPRGVGKTSCARIFAKTINCLSPTADGEACNECESCRAFNEGRSYNIVELDAASNNSVDDIRNITEQVRIPPQVGRYRVFIIDEVHMLTSSAFNAFLKTLEEPPHYVIFILATTEKHKVIPTILSRCQIYDFSRITVNDIADHLAYVAEQEGVTAEREALNVIASKADGAMRDALSIFDQVAASSRNVITYKSAIESLNVLDYEYYFRLTDMFLADDVKGALLLYKDIRDKGFDSLFFINGVGAHVRDLMMAADDATASLLEVGRDVVSRYREQAQKVTPRWCYAALDLCNTCDLNYRISTNKQLLVELTLIKLCQLSAKDASADTAAPQSPGVKDIKKEAAAQAPQTAPAASAQPAPKTASASPARMASKTVAAPRAAVEPPRSAVPHPRPTTVRISINKQDNDASASEADPAQRDKGKHEDVKPADFSRAWQEFSEKNSDRKILVNAMRTAVISKESGDIYRVKVANKVQIEEFEEAMTDLMPFLRSRLNNDFLRLSLELCAPSERPKVYTQREFLNKVVNENATIAKILKDFEAEML